ncbi:MAG: TetR/AcrR family transcriptional regulator [Gemmatimonadales bacterium]|nr:TetR/AcrR family transcriptional regulator [Gemmatimonadales bacterium]
MRYPEGHKDEVHDRIVKSTSQALRSHGLGGISIPALMKRAGLTHGGFYSHFPDRDALVAEAISAAAAETAEHVFGDDQQLPDVLDRYLSRSHLDHPTHGCVLAALGTDGARQPAQVRRAFSEAARGMLRLLERKLHPKKPTASLSDETLARASMMIGAVVLGRLVNDAPLADRILEAARKHSSD